MSETTNLRKHIKGVKHPWGQPFLLDIWWITQMYQIEPWFMLISVIPFHLLHRDGTSFWEIWKLWSSYRHLHSRNWWVGISVSNQPKHCSVILAVYSTNWLTKGTATGSRYMPDQYKIILHAMRQRHRSNLSVYESKRVAPYTAVMYLLYLRKTIKPALWSSLINHHIHVKQWDAITHQCFNVNRGLAKPPLMLGHGWLITVHIKMDVIRGPRTPVAPFTNMD